MCVCVCVCMSHGKACFCQIISTVQRKVLRLLRNITTPEDKFGSMNSHTCTYVTGTGVRGRIYYANLAFKQMAGINSANFC
jgi:hypothetical protein